MQLRPSHDFALAAAARITCCATLVSSACRPEAGTPVNEIEVAQQDTGTPPVVAEPDPYVSDPELDPSLRKQPITEAQMQIERCQGEVTAAIERGGFGPQQESCCLTLARSVYDVKRLEGMDPATAEQQQQGDYEIWWSVQGQCCPLVDWSESACTPWGPPTPPSRFASAPTPGGQLDLRVLARAQRPAGLDGQMIDDRLRAAAIATWRARMVNEYGSAPVFEGLV